MSAPAAPVQEPEHQEPEHQEPEPQEPERAFDPDAAWCLHPRVALRPEPFGALLYHFSTRRLSFLKERQLTVVVQGLADHPSARAACAAAGVGVEDGPVLAALATLADTGMIVRREAA
jgi:putative mycofactocin binding protein MftB